jgi:hypothetical protein
VGFRHPQVAESEDLGVAFVTAGDQPPEPRQDQPTEHGKWVHGRATVAVSRHAGKPMEPDPDEFSAPSPTARPWHKRVTDSLPGEEHHR